MSSCDSCIGQEVEQACCTIVKVRPQEAKRIKRYTEDNDIHWIKGEGIQCGFAQDGKCNIYDVRPWVCRAFGVVKQLPCSRFPEAAVIDFPLKQAQLTRVADPDDQFLGTYFELGYTQRMIEVLKAAV